MLVPRLRSLALPLARRCCAAGPPSPPPGALNRFWRLLRRPLVAKVVLPLPVALAGAYAGCLVLQDRFGTADNFFESRFTTNKDPDDIAEFYQAEDLLRIIAVHPILFNIFMNKVDPDTNEATEESALLSVEETHMRVKLLGMEVSFEIIEHEEEVDGETKIVSFLRHERFIDWFPLLADLGVKILLWDQTWRYGFDRLPDGSIEVYHNCEHFTGPWPIRLIVAIHQKYVQWACEKYINGESFGTEDLDAQQEELANIPLHVVRAFVSKLRVEKVKSLEARRKEAGGDAAAIERAEAELQLLDKLPEQATSNISVAKRPLERSPSSSRKIASKKLVVSDAATQEVLSAAMREAKGNLAVKAAVNDLVNSPELQFSDPTSSKIRRKEGRSPSSVRSAVAVQATRSDGAVGAQA